MKKTFFILTTVLLSFSASAQVGKMYTTSGDRSQSLTEVDVEGDPSDKTNGAIILLPQEEYQSIDGFGFALTYSSCYNLLKMTKEARTELLKRTYSMTEGYGVSYARI